jgi:hypothetical protein
MAHAVTHDIVVIDNENTWNGSTCLPDLAVQDFLYHLTFVQFDRGHQFHIITGMILDNLDVLNDSVPFIVLNGAMAAGIE